MPGEIKFGVIGGSGLYSMEGLEGVQEVVIDTPFGKPSAPILIGRLGENGVAFISRHGIGHHISPSEVNYRANIHALKSIGVERIISVSACGSLQESLKPGHIVVPDQLFDFTRDRKRSFFGDGLVAHIGTANPFCAEFSRHVVQSVKKSGGTVHEGGTFITIEGPRFSTRAESNVYRSWGMSIIGMTTSPEAFLAREAEMCYAVMAHVTDYDVWHMSEKPVTVEMIIKTLEQNTELAQKAIKNIVGGGVQVRECDCSSALESAMITRSDVIPAKTRNRLRLLIEK